MGEFLTFANGILPLLLAAGFTWLATRTPRQPVLYLLAAGAATVQAVEGTSLSVPLRVLVGSWVVLLAYQFYISVKKGV